MVENRQLPEMHFSSRKIHMPNVTIADNARLSAANADIPYPSLEYTMRIDCNAQIGDIVISTGMLERMLRNELSPEEFASIEQLMTPEILLAVSQTIAKDNSAIAKLPEWAQSLVIEKILPLLVYSPIGDIGLAYMNYQAKQENDPKLPIALCANAYNIATAQIEGKSADIAPAYMNDSIITNSSPMTFEHCFMNRRIPNRGVIATHNCPHTIWSSHVVTREDSQT